jgi:hypothetical protein
LPVNEINNTGRSGSFLWRLQRPSELVTCFVDSHFHTTLYVFIHKNLEATTVNKDHFSDLLALIRLILTEISKDY